MLDKKFCVFLIFSFIAFIIIFTIFETKPQGPGVTAKGPGGPCRISMKIVGVKSPKAPARLSSVQVCLYQTDDYTKPVATLVTDSKGKFTIISLPEGTFDIILRSNGFFSKKIPDIKLDSHKSSKLDHKAIYSLEMSCGKIIICFKEGTPVEEQNEIIAKSGLVFKDTLKINPKAGGNPVIFLVFKTPEPLKIPGVIDYFIEIPSIRYAYPERGDI